MTLVLLVWAILDKSWKRVASVAFVMVLISGTLGYDKRLNVAEVLGFMPSDRIAVIFYSAVTVVIVVLVGRGIRWVYDYFTESRNENN